MKKEKRFYTIVLLVLAAILIWYLVPVLFKGVGALTPFLFAFATAYLLRHPVMWLERLLFGKKAKKQNAWRHTVSSITVLIVFLGLLSLLIAVLIPNIINNIYDIANGMPGFIENTKQTLTDSIGTLSEKLNIDINTYVVDYLDSATDKILAAVTEIMNPQKIVITATNVLSSAASGIVSAVMYVISTFYLLHDYDSIKTGIKRSLRVFIREEEKYEKICELLHKSDVTVEKYIVVKLSSSFCLGIVAYVGFVLFKLPYPILLASVVAVTNIVPYLGPIVGAIPPILVALASNGVQSALWVGIFILICQQIEGNLLTPLLTGGALQVSPLLVLVGIAVFGAMMGIVGMILGAPIAAIIAGVFRGAVNKAEQANKESEKNENSEKEKI